MGNEQFFNIKKSAFNSIWLGIVVFVLATAFVSYNLYFEMTGLASKRSNLLSNIEREMYDVKRYAYNPSLEILEIDNTNALLHRPEDYYGKFIRLKSQVTKIDKKAKYIFIKLDKVLVISDPSADGELGLEDGDEVLVDLYISSIQESLQREVGMETVVSFLISLKSHNGIGL